jgi:hypothetical protein
LQPAKVDTSFPSITNTNCIRTNNVVPRC